MDMDHHSLFQSRQYFEILILDIVFDLQHMAGIDEQDVIFPKRLNKRKGHHLNLCWNQFSEAGEAPQKGFIGIRFYSYQFAVIHTAFFFVLQSSLSRELGRGSGPNLNDPAGLKMPDHTVEDLCVHTQKSVIVQVIF